ncbi:MAG: sigma factor-like helix-turn-helix DNA-binding protein [Candidatus Pacebacteria bacterium]|nr:sigma factor-like helix-turn-helix DNA-binding protein [Candidatus Paceibacterota bacterium]
MNFNYQQICSTLLKDLSPRAKDIVKRRFGLKSSPETLDLIGKSYGVTRERVRQIENEALVKIRERKNNFNNVFIHFNDAIEKFGGLKKEESLLDYLGEGKLRNQIFFLLTLSDDFKRYSEDKNYYPYWAKDKDILNSAKKVIDLTMKKLKSERNPLDLDELFESENTDIFKALNRDIDKDIFNSYIEISKVIRRNPEGKFGFKEWVEINPKGIKDKAYLVLKKQGKCLHFSEVAELIKNSPYFSKNKIHTATVHNELIKDPRFILVGRGLYGLKEWGYESGIVKEVILKVLNKAEKPLPKDDIIKGVLAQRFVKENTVFLNLSDRNWFVRRPDGTYIVNPALKSKSA